MLDDLCNPRSNSKIFSKKELTKQKLQYIKRISKKLEDKN